MDRHTASDAVDAGLLAVNVVARHVPIAEVTVVLGSVTEVVKLVKDTINKYTDCEEICKRISSSVHDLELIYRELSDILQKDNFPESCIHGFKKLKNSLLICKNTCNKYKTKKTSTKVSKTSYYLKKLQIIENELNSTIHYLQLALQLGMISKQKEQRKAQHGIMRKITNTREGVYPNPFKYREVPCRPEQPCAAKLNETKMIISWIDVDNAKHNILRYEVMLDSGMEQLFPFPVTELTHEEVTVSRLETNSGQFDLQEISNSNNTEDSAQSASTGLKYSVCFCPPILSEEEFYEVKVRAVNGRGPSEWSDESLFRYYSGHPKQPQIISLDATKPCEVEIEVKIYEQEHPINEILVAYANINDPTQTRWDIRNISEDFKSTAKNQVEKTSTITGKIDNLDPSNYRFKVAVRSSFGQSPWSLPDDISQDNFPPGAPSNADFIEDGNNKKLIIITWEKPLENPLGVHEYRVRYKKEGRNKKWIHQEVISKNNEAYEAKDLKTDQTYIFQIESVNRIGKGNASEIRAKNIKETVPDSQTNGSHLRRTQTGFRAVKPTSYGSDDEFEKIMSYNIEEYDFEEEESQDEDQTEEPV